MPDDTAIIEREEVRNNNLPAPPPEASDLPVLADPLSMMSLPVSLQIFFNDQLFRRCQTVANYLAKAEGYAPRHLIGKPEACFAVVSRALTWRLDPYAVAQATYQTPNGQVGYYGSLCQAIIENSGRLDPSFGGVKFEHVGDWSKLRGKFKLATGQRGGEYPVPAWEQFGPIEADLGVIVRAKMREEDNPREMPFDLVQAYPRNSTLWATDPRTQICYTAVRRFSTSTVPSLFMGVPFDHEDMSDWVSGLRDVTPPRPELGDFTEGGEAPRTARRGSRRAAAPTEDAKAEATPPTAPKKWFFSDEVGEIFEFEDVDEAVSIYAQRLEAAKGNHQLLEATWDNGARLLSALRDRGHADMADALNTAHGQLLADLIAAENAADAAKHAAGREPGATAAEPAQEEQGADFDVAVPWPDGMAGNMWYQNAAAKLREMRKNAHPRADFIRFGAVNSAKIGQLRHQSALPSWAKLLEQEITKSAAAAT